MPIIPLSTSAVIHGALVPISNYTVTSVVSDIVFNSIPQIYQDIKVIMYSRSANANTYGNNTMYFNGTGATGWSQTQLLGDGSSPSSSRSTTSGPTYGPLAVTSGAYSATNIFSTTTWDIFNYRGSTFKTVLYRSTMDLNGSGFNVTGAANWADTSAVSTIQVSSTNMQIGTRISIYGVRSASQ